MNDPYQTGIEFAQLFGRFEFALKRAGLLRAKVDAQASWEAYAEKLGPDFFKLVLDSNIAPTLIALPPRKLMADGLKWLPENPQPLQNVRDLFLVGVCRVRNSLMHGEKFTGGLDGWDRDAALLTEALAVLKLAKGRVEEVEQYLAEHAGKNETT